MKKKLVTLILAGTMAFSMAACGESNEPSEKGGAEEVVAEDSAGEAGQSDTLEESIDEADQAIQDAAEASGTDVTTVDEATEAINEVAQGGGPATMERFNQIKTDMTYEEVKEILGEDGVESISAENSATSMKIYQWAGDTPGSNITVSFMDNKVVSAEQIGLE